jgi:copper chaperone CopZ
MTQVLNVTGMTCGHCAHAVTEELSALSGVASVDVQLVPHGVTTISVEADRDLTTGEVAGALAEAGDYRLA